MVHVRMAQVDHYEAKAISSNHQRNMLKLMAGHIWYPKVRGLLPTLVSRTECGCAILAEDPLASGLIYVLKFSCNSTYFIWKVSKNTSYS